MSTLKAATTNQSVDFSVFDSIGDAVTSRTFSDFTTTYLRYLAGIPLAAGATAITEATLGAINAVHADGGIIHVGNGVYRFDLPDAATAAGADALLVSIVSGTSGDTVVYQNMIPITAIEADVSAILIDTGTTLPATLSTLSTFDPATDTVDIGKISGDAPAADNLESILDGTGGQIELAATAGKPGLRLASSVVGKPALEIVNSEDQSAAVTVSAPGSQSHAINISDDSGRGVFSATGLTGIGDAVAAEILTTPANTIGTDASGNVRLVDVDGVAESKLRELLLASLMGKTQLTDNGDGTKTLRFYKQDGTTPMADVTFNISGEHTITIIDPAP